MDATKEAQFSRTVEAKGPLREEDKGHTEEHSYRPLDP